MSSKFSKGMTGLVVGVAFMAAGAFSPVQAEEIAADKPCCAKPELSQEMKKTLEEKISQMDFTMEVKGLTPTYTQQAVTNIEKIKEVVTLYPEMADFAIKVFEKQVKAVYSDNNIWVTWADKKPFIDAILSLAINSKREDLYLRGVEFADNGSLVNQPDALKILEVSHATAAKVLEQSLNLNRRYTGVAMLEKIGMSHEDLACGVLRVLKYRAAVKPEDKPVLMIAVKNIGNKFQSARPLAEEILQNSGQTLKEFPVSSAIGLPFP